MKLKFKQSMFVIGSGNIDAGRELEIKDKAQAESLIKAGFAEEVVEVKKPIAKEDPKEAVKVEKPKPAAKSKTVKDGE